MFLPNTVLAQAYIWTWKWQRWETLRKKRVAQAISSVRGRGHLPLWRLPNYLM